MEEEMRVHFVVESMNNSNNFQAPGCSLLWNRVKNSIEKKKWLIAVIILKNIYIRYSNISRQETTEIWE